VLEHPHLPPVLALVAGRRPLEGERLRLVDRPPATLHHEVGKREVVAEARIDLGVVRPAQRIDGAVAGRDRAEPRLSLARHELVAPVDALLVRAVGRLEPQAAADVRDSRIREVADELPQRIRRPGRVRVGEGDHLRLRRPDRRVLGSDLAAARVPDHPGAGGLRELLGPVGGGVGGDDELEQLRRVVERAKVVEAPLDRALLVVGGDDHRDGRQVLGSRATARVEETPHERDSRRVERVCPGERGQ
jgi:hypothetical protein